MNSCIITKNKIAELCRQHTDLSIEDVSIIENMSLSLQTYANLMNADIFIDCLTRDINEAIVVAEAKPENGNSMYKTSVVGQLALRKNEPAVLRTLELGMVSKDLKALTQENINVRQTVAPIKNGDKIIGVLIAEKAITGRLESNKHMDMITEGYQALANTLLSLTEGKSTIVNHLDEAILIFDEEGIARFANPIADSLYKKLGYRDEIVGMSYDNLALDETSFSSIVEKLQQDKNLELYEKELKVGKLFLQMKKLVFNNKNLKLVIMIKDITEVKLKDKELILKSVAIKEIHHRVKNNLQTIASLLRLQARRTTDTKTKEALDESMSRILSMATTHELLAQEGIDEVSIIEVITNIKENIMRFFHSSEYMVEVNVSGDNFKVNSDKATSIALIINELLQNSLRHAFKGRNSGIIDITVKQGSAYSSIEVTDNGIGFKNKQIRSNSLGFSIVNSIIKEKLGGSIKVSTGAGGTKVFFDFKN